MRAGFAAPAAAEGITLDGGQPDFYTREGCLHAVEQTRQTVDSTESGLQFDDSQLYSLLEEADLLCRTGDIGEAGHLLEQVNDGLSRLVPEPPEETPPPKDAVPRLAPR